MIVGWNILFAILAGSFECISSTQCSAQAVSTQLPLPFVPFPSVVYVLPRLFAHGVASGLVTIGAVVVLGVVVLALAQVAVNHGKKKKKQN